MAMNTIEHDIHIIQQPMIPGQIRGILKDIYQGQKDAPDLMAILIRIAGDVTSAYMLEQALYWDAKMKRLWYKSKRSWQEQAGLSRHQVERCEAVLKRLGILTTQVQPAEGWPSPVTHYRVEWGVFWTQFAAAVGRALDELMRWIQAAGNPPINTRESDESIRDKVANQPATNAPVDMRESRQTPTDTSTDTPATTATGTPAAEDARAGMMADGEKTGGSRTAPTAAETPADGDTEPSIEFQEEREGDAVATSPPPVPRAPLPSAEAVREDPYWQAFRRAWCETVGIEPDFPAAVAEAYTGCVAALRVLGATAEEVEQLTRWKIAHKRKQRDEGKDAAPYRFVWLSIDLPEWRDRQKNGGSDAGWEKYLSGRYAPLIHTGMVAN